MRIPRNKLNDLEKVAFKGEQGVDEARWAQAEEVSCRQEQGETFDEIAFSWINLRTGKAYSHQYVVKCARAWRRFGSADSRPLWTAAYAATSYPPDVSPDEAHRRKRADTARWDKRRRVPAKPSTLLRWAGDAIEKQVEIGRVEALWELEEALAALMEAVERARALVFEGVAA